LRTRLNSGDLNYLVTNHLPRRLANRFIAWFSRIEQPVIRDSSLWLWQRFCDDLRLYEAEKARFSSLHDCFIRELKPGARPVDDSPGVLISPCDAVVGSFGKIQGNAVLQAKQSWYQLSELLLSEEEAVQYEGGWFVTLRLKSSMYHRFHSPVDAGIDHIRYVSGDTWNVNPETLERKQGVFCRNERVIFPLQQHSSDRQDNLTRVPVTLVAVAAILVSSVRIHSLPVSVRDYGDFRITVGRSYQKGEEIGYFEHGSTIVLLTGQDWVPAPTLEEGRTIRMGEHLMSEMVGAT